MMKGIKKKLGLGKANKEIISKEVEDVEDLEVDEVETSDEELKQLILEAGFKEKYADFILFEANKMAEDGDEFDDILAELVKVYPEFLGVDKKARTGISQSKGAGQADLEKEIAKKMGIII